MDSPLCCPHCLAPRSLDDGDRCPFCGGGIGDLDRTLESTSTAELGDSTSVSADSPPEFSPGDKLADRFELRKLIGAGGMGEVWLGYDQPLRRLVAIKVLPRNLRLDPVAMENLRRETVRCQKLSHPHIVRVHDLHEDGDHAFLSMEYVEGKSLAGLRIEQSKGVLSWEALRPWMRQLADALDFAHRERIIHRDVKPANMILDADGRLKLGDFGVAATVNDTVNHISAHHPTSGTVAFMSPQQMEGLLPRNSDDVYSFGATLYQLLTGKPPFFSGDIHYQLKHKAPSSVRERLKEFGIENSVPAAVDDAILKCLAKLPQDRPMTCGAAVAEMEGASLENVAASGKEEFPLPGAPAKPSVWSALRNAYGPLFSWKFLRARRAVGSITAIATVACGLALLHPVLGKSWAQRSYDLTQLFLGDFEVDEIAVVTLDSMSHQVLEQPTTRPWDRSLHARLIERMREEGARQIVFDIIFDEPGPDPEADRKFADALDVSDTVLCGEILVESFGNEAEMETLVSPVAEFSERSSWGVANLPIDDDYGIRLHPLPYDQVLPLAHAAHSQATGNRFTAAGLPARDRWLRYYGPPGTLPRLSYHRALDTEGTPPGFFRDKTVFVGATQSTGFTGAGKDEYRNPVPLSGGGFFSGVEVEATVYLNLLRRDWLTRFGVLSSGVLGILFGLIVGYLLAMLRPAAAVGLAVAVAFALVGVVAVGAVWAHVWGPWLVGLAQLVCALAVGLALNAIRDRIQLQMMERFFAVHFPAARVRQMLKEPTRLEPGSEKRELTILTVEVADFGRVADRMVDDNLYVRVNEYFDTVISAVHQHEGTVIRLSGERALAVWNAPEDQTNHQTLAARAALEIVRQIGGETTKSKALGIRAVVGIHFGAAAIGNFGNLERMEYTVAGTSVEVAAEISHLNGMLKTRVLATESVIAKLASDIVCRPLGWFGLRRTDRRVELYEIMDVADPQMGGAWVERFSDGLLHFRERDWDAAEREFNRVLEECPDDGPTQYFLAAVRQFRERPPAGAWRGEIMVA